jgi:hypothetical protein
MLRIAILPDTVDEHRVRAVDNMPVGSDVANSIDDEAGTLGRAGSIDCSADLKFVARVVCPWFWRPHGKDPDDGRLYSGDHFGGRFMARVRAGVPQCDGKPAITGR